MNEEAAPFVDDTVAMPRASLAMLAAFRVMSMMAVTRATEHAQWSTVFDAAGVVSLAAWSWCEPAMTAAMAAAGGAEEMVLAAAGSMAGSTKSLAVRLPSSLTAVCAGGPLCDDGAGNSIVQRAVRQPRRRQEQR